MVRKYTSFTLVVVFMIGLLNIAINDQLRINAEAKQSGEENSLEYAYKHLYKESAEKDELIESLQNDLIDEIYEVNYLKSQLNMKEDADKYLDSLHIVVPEDIKEICEEAGAEFGFQPEWLEAICFKESGFHEDIIAANGQCKGLMQVNVVLHADKIDKYGGLWINKRTNIYAACEVIQDYIDKGYEDLGQIMSLYHGEGNSENYSDYTEKVALITAALERSNGK